MRERPILFSAPMVRAILAGAKTQTRRAVRFEYAADVDRWGDRGGGVWEMGIYGEGGACASMGTIRCPYGAPGDRLWVRETWQAIHVSIDPETGYGDDVRAADKIPSDSQHGYWGVAYAATDPQANEHRDDRGFVWRPGIHMPRWASRITLEVTGVRVERLLAITEDDARAEGVDGPHWGRWTDLEGRLTPPESAPARPWAHSFFVAWSEINGRDSLWANPWVWVVEFRRVEAHCNPRSPTSTATSSEWRA